MVFMVRQEDRVRHGTVNTERKQILWIPADAGHSQDVCDRNNSITIQMDKRMHLMKDAAMQRWVYLE